MDMEEIEKVYIIYQYPIMSHFSMSHTQTHISHCAMASHLGYLEL